MQLDRRKFIQMSAMAAATAVAHAQVGDDRAFALPVINDTPDRISWDKAPCRFCGTGCHVQVGVQGGKVVTIRGDGAAEVNKGLLCVKGYHVGMILYGKDRMTQPLLKKDGKHVPISWDDAIDIIARRIMRNGKGFAIYGSGQWTIPEGYASQKLIKGGLSNNHIDPNARLCMASAVTGFLSTYGVDEPAGCYDDLDACDTLIMWGNNPAEMHPVLFSRVIDRRAKGDKVKIIDMATRRTRTTDFSDEYLEFKPGTDLAIANGIAHLLIKNGTYDKAFVEKYCNYRGHTPDNGLFGEAISFEAYKKGIEAYTPEHVEKISGVPTAKMRMLGDLFGDPKRRITSLWCMGMNQHTRGTAINRLVHGIHLLSGHFGKPGDAPTSLTGQPSACGTAREVGTLAHALPGGRVVANDAHRQQCEDAWNLPHGRINAEPGYHTVKMWEQFCTPTKDGGDIDTIWVQVTNPGQSLPNLHKLFNAKQGLEDKCLIVSEVYPTATTELADLVLPSAMWVEKNGVYGNSERRTQQWFKMVEPPGDARDDCWQTIAVAKRLLDLGHKGMRDKDGKFLFHMEDDDSKAVPVWEWQHYYDINVDRVLYEEYRPLTHIKHKNVAPYDVLVKRRGLRWPVVETSPGVWRETKFRFSGFDDPFVKDSDGIEFYHSTTGDGKAQIWFQPYEPPPEVPDEKYPMWLSTGRVLEHWHTGTMTMRAEPLRKAMPKAYVEMHPDDAAALGLQNGEVVSVVTRRGRISLPLWLRGRGHPPKGSIFVPFFDEKLLINEITLGAVDPVSKEPDYKKCAALVCKIGQEPDFSKED